MISITSSSVERSHTWLRSTTAPINTNVVNTASLRKPNDNQETVSLSTQGIEQAQKVAQSAPVNPYADTIAGFIRQQLQRDVADGADKQALESRLAAGYQGFLQGFDDAYALLGGTAALPDEVNAQLMATKQQVGEQMNKLAEELGIKSPVAPAPEESPSEQLQDALNNLVNATQTDRFMPFSAHSDLASQAQSRSLNLRLTTAEGDIIELIADNRNSIAVKASDRNISAAQEQSQQWSLSIQGDLNSQEQSAIAGFINKLGHVADEFYRGDLARAVEQATGVGYDNQQISAFSMSMQQVDIKRVETAYQGPQAGANEVKNPQQSRWHVMGQWISQLEQLRTDSLNSGLPKDWLNQLAKQSLEQLYPDEKLANGFIQDHLKGY